MPEKDSSSIPTDAGIGRECDQPAQEFEWLTQELQKINLPLNNGSLFLTNIRTFQQHRKSIQHLRGQPFKTRTVPPRLCKSYKSLFIKVNQNKIESISFTKIPCNSWTCPACKFKKAIRLKYLVKDIITLNNLSYFLTLTLDPSLIPEGYRTDDTNNTHKYITKLFNHLLTIIRRKPYKYFDKKSEKWLDFNLSQHEEKLKYVWIIEFQKNGNAHLHILLNKFLPVDVLREVWTDIGGGHIMRVDYIRTIEGIAMYLTNYIVKGIKYDSTDKTGFKFFERRYSVSKSCERPTKFSTATNLLKEIPENYQEFYLSLLNLKSLHTVIEHRDWENNFTLPVNPGSLPS